MNDATLYSGSLVFFAGRGFLSRAIALRTCSFSQLIHRQWISHVGFTIDHEGIVMLIESTTLDKTPCFIRRVPVKGVQAHPLMDRINEYDGHVWWSKPNVTGMTQKYIENRAKLLHDIAIPQLGQAYDEVGALIAGTVFLKERFHFNPAHFFCSELTVEDLSRVNMSPARRDLSAGAITPADIALSLRYGHGYGEMVKQK